MFDMRSTRKALGLSQEQLAGELGLKQSTISKFENGLLPVDDRTQLAIEALVMRAAAQAEAA